MPWDFSHVAEHALAHAVKISRMVNNDICLLHIVDTGINPKAYAEKTTLLKRLVEENGKKYNVPIIYHISKGSIFTSIAEYVNEKEASLVVMGTHGMKGMQKLTGSWALKVIVKSKIPFIVVQDPPADQERYHNIVFPVDFRNENKEKIKMAIFMGKYFESKIHMLVSVTSDKSLLKKTKMNLNFAVKYLIQNNIDYEIHDMPKGKIAEQTIDFAQKVKCRSDPDSDNEEYHFCRLHVRSFRTTYYCQQFQNTCLLCKSHGIVCKCRTIYGWLGIIKKL